MDSKTLHPPARSATPAISFRDFPAELAISFRVKSQAGPLDANWVQRATPQVFEELLLLRLRKTEYQPREGRQ